MPSTAKGSPCRYAPASNASISSLTEQTGRFVTNTTGCVRQVPSAYSVIVRSLENGPIAATLRIAMAAHASAVGKQRIDLLLLRDIAQRSRPAADNDRRDRAATGRSAGKRPGSPGEKKPEPTSGRSPASNAGIGFVDVARDR